MAKAKASGAKVVEFKIGQRYKLSYENTSVTATCFEIRPEWGDGSGEAGQVDDFAFIPGDHPFSNKLGMFLVDQDWEQIYQPPKGHLKAGGFVCTALPEHAEEID